MTPSIRRGRPADRADVEKLTDNNVGSSAAQRA